MLNFLIKIIHLKNLTAIHQKINTLENIYDFQVFE